MRYFFIENYDEILHLKGPLTPEKIRDLENALVDHPWTVVTFPDGVNVYEWQGRSRSRDRACPQVLSKVLPPSERMSYIADSDNCLLVRGAKSTLEMALAMLYMVQGTEAQRL